MGVLLHSASWTILNYFDITGFVRSPQTMPKVYQ
jgi:hypothetical protein